MFDSRPNPGACGKPAVAGSRARSQRLFLAATIEGYRDRAAAVAVSGVDTWARDAARLRRSQVTYRLTQRVKVRSEVEAKRCSVDSQRALSPTEHFLSRL